VTVGPAWSQVLGHAVRKRLLLALKSCPGTFAPLTGASDEELIKLFVGGHSETLVSTDLTRATDLLPLDLVGAIVDGLAESGRMSSLEIEILRALSGPQVLNYGKEQVTSSRGVLMGLPTSWCLLSIVHLWWLDEVRRTSGPGVERRAHRGSICGDDALLATTAKGADRYREIVALSGGSPSEGKHYECLGKKGNLRGVFLEKLLEFDHDKGFIRAGVINGAIPVKGLTSRSLPRQFFGTTPIRCDSFALVQLMVLDTLGARPSAGAACWNYIQTRVPWLGRYGRIVLGLAPGHPLALGGYRFAKRTPEGDALAKLVRDQGTSFTTAVRRESDPDWRTAHQWCGQGRQLAVDEGELVDVGLLPPASSGFVGPLQRGVVRLPEGEWLIKLEEEREMATMIGMFCQVKAFSERKSEVFQVRSKDLARKLRRMRREGALHPVDLPIDGNERLRRLIAWKVLQEGDTERGTSWLADSSLPRCQAVGAVARSHQSLGLQAPSATA
jgi:hypothetical protein